MRDNRLRLHLTGVGSVIVDREKEVTNTIPRCDNGLTMEQYEDLNIPYNKIPQELKDRKKAQDDEELEVEEVYSGIIIFYDQIKLIVEDDEGYTVIFLEDGLTVEVLETALEIDSYIDYIQMSWLEKQGQYLLAFWRKIKWNMSKEKKQLDKQMENNGK